MYDLPLIDEAGELVGTLSCSNPASAMRSVPPGHSLLIEMPPSEPSWWDSQALAWVAKPAQPSRHHEWDAVGKAWRDPRTPEQLASERLAEVRRIRDAALSASDVDALRALDALLPAPLRARRQALRDIPAAVDPVAALAIITGVQIEPA